MLVRLLADPEDCWIFFISTRILSSRPAACSIIKKKFIFHIQNDIIFHIQKDIIFHTQKKFIFHSRRSEGMTTNLAVMFPLLFGKKPHDFAVNFSPLLDLPGMQILETVKH